LHDPKNSFEGKEIYMRFDVVSRKVVQTSPTHSEHFWNTSFDFISAESIDGRR